ncbi:MAG: hypothetical protein IJN42_01335 [Clostridia bacterium]|nr:hypothetical protein [Clostridia bacterium]
MALEDMISSILSDPKSMQTISSLLAGLGDEQEDTPAAPPSLPDTAQLEQLGGVLKKLGGPPDERCQLLLALRPFVDRDKRERIDQSVQLLKLMSLAESVGGLGLV